MKVLLLTDIPPCSNYTAGLVLGQLAMAVPAGGIACFAVVNKHLKPQLLPELDGMPLAITEKPNEVGVIRYKPDASGEQKPYQTKSDRRKTRSVEGRRRVVEQRRLLAEAEAFGRQHKVDALWVLMEGQTIVRMARPLAKRLRVPLFTMVFDPLSWWLRDHFVDKINTKLDLREFDLAISESKHCATASWAMAEAYQQRYNVPSVPVISAHPRSSGRAPAPQLRHDYEFVIGMAGQFYAQDEWLALVDALNAAGWQIRGRNVRIKVMGHKPPEGAIPPEALDFLGYQTQSEVIRVLSEECDVSYCPYPFRPELEEVSRYSFPSKIAVYLAAGRPVVFHGPGYSSPAGYFARTGGAIQCDQPDATAIYSALEWLVADPDIYRGIAEAAVASFAADFTFESQRRNLWEFLETDINGFTAAADAPAPAMSAGPHLAAVLNGLIAQKDASARATSGKSQQAYDERQAELDELGRQASAASSEIVALKAREDRMSEDTRRAREEASELAGKLEDAGLKIAKLRSFADSTIAAAGLQDVIEEELNAFRGGEIGVELLAHGLLSSDHPALTEDLPQTSAGRATRDAASLVASRIGSARAAAQLALEERDAARVAMAALSSELADTQVQFAKVLEAGQLAAEERDSARLACAALGEQLVERADALRVLEAGRNALTQQLVRVEEDADGVKKSLALAKEDRARLQDDLDGALAGAVEHARLLAEERARFDELGRKMDTAHAEQAKLTAALSKSQVLLGETEAAHIALQDAMAAERQASRAVARDLEFNTVDLKRLTERLARVQQENGDLADELFAAQVRHRKAEAARRLMEFDRDAQTALAARVRAEADDERERVSRQLREAQEQAGRDRAQIEEVTRQRSGLQSALDQTLSEHKAVIAALHQGEDEIAALNARLADQQAAARVQYDEVIGHRAGLQTMLDQAITERDGALAALRTQADEVAALKVRLDAMEIASDGLAAERDTLSSELCTAAEGLFIARTRVQALEEQIEVVKGHRGGLQTMLDQVIIERDAMIPQLQATTNELEGLRSKAGELQRISDNQLAGLLGKLSIIEYKVSEAINPDTSDASGAATRRLYLDLMEASLTGTLNQDASMAPWLKGFDPVARSIGRDWPTSALTMIGTARMRNLRHLCEQMIDGDVAGDFIETGVWRGGACIYMRAILAAYGDRKRKVWVADSFRGLPPPDAARFPADSGDLHHTEEQLSIPISKVREGFERYGLLDRQVEFLPGWFKDTLPVAPISKLAILRLDGDMYESTIQALEALYEKVSTGGAVIVDDYVLPACKQAVDDFRHARRIRDELVQIDGAAMYWRKSASRSQKGKTRASVAPRAPQRNSRTGRSTRLNRQAAE